MTKITQSLIRKKAEHHDGLLSDLQELSLHQLNIEKIESLSRVCPRLQILYLQNNLVGKLENLRRMKDLRYLNMALNNIKKIEGLGSCEKLAKLDFTVNFIDVDFFQKSIENLKKNRELKELYLTGNPCTEFKGWKEFVIHTLQQIGKLDGVEITKSERILAKQNYEEIKARLQKEAQKMRDEKGIVYDEDADLDDDEDNDLDFELIDSDTDDEAEIEWSAENRIKERRREQAREKKKKAKEGKDNKFAQPPDQLKEARKRMNQKVTVVGDELPSQRNLGKYPVALKEETDKIVVTVGVPRFLDTSLLDVDVHPRWFQACIKDNLLLMHFPEEVNVDKGSVKRNPVTGELILTLPIADGVLNDARRLRLMRKKKEEQERKEGVTKDSSLEEIAEAKLTMSDTDYRNIVKKKSKKEQAQIREISAKRSDKLEAERQNRLSAEEKRREEAAQKRRQAALTRCNDGDSDDDCPDLI